MHIDDAKIPGSTSPMLRTVTREDGIDVHIGLGEDERLEVSKRLSGMLASTYMLYLKTLYYHWNVTGPHFVGLHTLFEGQYEDLHKAGDALAERVRALGHFTPGTFGEFIKLSSIKDDAQLPHSPEQMIRNLLQANEGCSNEARMVLGIAEKCSDQVTLDMMTGRMTSHDKAAWFLRALLQ